MSLPVGTCYTEHKHIHRKNGPNGRDCPTDTSRDISGLRVVMWGVASAHGEGKAAIACATRARLLFGKGDFEFRFVAPAQC